MSATEGDTELIDPQNDTSLCGGRRVFGRYFLERLVGRGGMGVVWKARDETLDRPVALKFLPDLFFLDAAARDDLKRETRRSLDLTHPHIVRIHDFIEDEEMAAIAMEYVDGPNLSQLRVERPSRCFEPEELSYWVTGLCAGLAYAHDSGLCVHRDLKPSNLMVNSRGALKITDFGIACSMHNTAARVSAWSSTGGTLGYMSPQQLMGDLASPSDDIYSVGATLYELLTGKPPFYSGDLSTQIREVVAESITARRQKLGLPAPPISPAWEETIAACLAKDPRQRPASANEIAQRFGLTVQPLAETAASLRENLAPTFCGPVPLPVAVTTSRAESQLRPYLAFLKQHRWPIIAGIAVLCAILPWLVRPHLQPSSEPAAPQTSAAVHPAESPAAPTSPITAAPAAPAPLAIPGGSTAPAEQPTPAEPTPAPAQNVAADSPAPSASEPKAQFRVETIPAGIPFQVLASAYETPIAEVRGTGISPATLYLPKGGYRIVFAPAGQTSRTASVQVSAAEGTVFQQEFPHGMVKVRSQPESAEVICDGQSVGNAPLDLPLLPGRHDITTRWNGREARVKTVQLVDAGEQSLAFDFRSGSSPVRSHHAKKKEDDSVLTKIGRSFKNLFDGDSAKKH